MTVRNAASMGTHGATWESRGYCGAGNVMDLIDSLRGHTAVVCGSATGVFQEFDDVLRKYPDAIVFGVNDVGMYLSKIDHWVSLHADHLGPWKGVRWLKLHDYENAKLHGIDPRPYINYVWHGLRPLFALSGYFAMQIAYIMGASQIILCGCPGDLTSRFFEAGSRSDGFGYGNGTKVDDSGVREQLENEMKRLPEFKECVRSMSGWTRDYFGGI